MPITDFYEFHNKMSMSQIPLPTIVFKYEPSKARYLPANPKFRDYLFRDIRDLARVNEEDLSDQFEHRSVVLENLLIHVYAGREKAGWKMFEENYILNDKAEIRRRVKAILRRQPVYNFIY